MSSQRRPVTKQYLINMGGMLTGLDGCTLCRPSNFGCPPLTNGDYWHPKLLVMLNKCKSSHMISRHLKKSFAGLPQGSPWNDLNDTIWFCSLPFFDFLFFKNKWCLWWAQTDICACLFFHTTVHIKFRLRWTLLIHLGILKNLSFGPLIESRAWPIKIFLQFVKSRTMFH